MSVAPINPKGSEHLRELANFHRSGSIASNNSSSVRSQESRPSDASSFSEILKIKSEELKFSSHASSRIKSRNIEMTQDIMNKLEKAVTGAAGKGAKDSLILMKNLAFIVNVPNRTVITAMDGSSIKDNVFTNIDSTVIAE